MGYEWLKPMNFVWLHPFDPHQNLLAGPWIPCDGRRAPCIISELFPVCLFVFLNKPVASLCIVHEYCPYELYDISQVQLPSIIIACYSIELQSFARICDTNNTIIQHITFSSYFIDLQYKWCISPDKLILTWNHAGLFKGVLDKFNITLPLKIETSEISIPWEVFVLVKTACRLLPRGLLLTKYYYL